jgi:glycyl-tRNA synthetase beta chain
LLPHFVTVSNVQSKDPKEVKRGTQRVIVPRITHAMFFWDLDKGARLDTPNEHLETMLFQKELGSDADKQKRVAALAESVARYIGGVAGSARRAAALAKCDLLSNLVGEFPELQGSVGHRVALVNGEAPEVPRAIEEHYLPRFAGDRLPESKTGQALAIADKLDSVSGIFSIGQKPTGDKDPFALKRAGLGLMRILLEKQLDLDLVGLVKQALAAQPVQGKATPEDVYDFLLERLKAYYLETGIRPDVFEAVRAKQPRRPLDFQRRVQAVNEFLRLPEAAALAAANKRIANILRQAGGAPAAEAKPELFKLPAENALHEQIRRLRDEVDSLTKTGDYAAALKKLAALRAPVDAFFDQVMVMDPDAAIKANRLALLASLSALFLQIADLSLIQVD